MKPYDRFHYTRDESLRFNYVKYVSAIRRDRVTAIHDCRFHPLYGSSRWVNREWPDEWPDEWRPFHANVQTRRDRALDLLHRLRMRACGFW